MESNRRPFPGIASRSGRWTASSSGASLCGRYPLDSSHRGSLERSAGLLSITSHLLASFEAVDGGRHLGNGVGTIASQTRPTTSHRSRRVVCRRDVFVRKKRGEKVGKTKRGKGTKLMVLTDGHGIPLGIDTASASPHEVTLIEPLLERRVLRRKPLRLIYDAAADSDPLRARLRQRGIELICPHRTNRINAPTQDGRKFRRYRRRWKVERSISWIQNFRRLVTRYEYHAHLFHGFAQLACLIVVLGRF
jgi:transposase